MRMLVLAMAAAIGAAAVVGPATAQPAQQPAQHPACAPGDVWLPAYWNRVNRYHRGQCITMQEYQHLWTHLHS